MLFVLRSMFPRLKERWILELSAHSFKLTAEDLFYPTRPQSARTDGAPERRRKAEAGQVKFLLPTRPQKARTDGAPDNPAGAQSARTDGAPMHYAHPSAARTDGAPDDPTGAQKWHRKFLLARLV